MIPANQFKPGLNLRLARASLSGIGRRAGVSRMSSFFRVRTLCVSNGLRVVFKRVFV
jgi:hypothetical protein